MPDPIVPDEKKPDEKPIGVEVREKSFQQILKEQQVERTKPEEKPEEKIEENAKEDEEKKAKDAEEEKNKQEDARKAEEARQASIAKAAADEVLKQQEEAKQKELDKERLAEEEKQKQDALKASWEKDPNAQKDKDGNPIPKSYKELSEETARIAEEKAYARLKAEQEKTDAEIIAKTEDDAKKSELAKEQATRQAEQFQAELNAELLDLYTTGSMPRIKDPKDTKDPGLLERDNLFKTAMEVNTKLIAGGKPPIRSIKQIYKDHYKPLAAPAGHDAPVMGNESTISTAPPEDKYIPARDRGKSMAQLVKEEAQRISRKMQIRGN